MSSCILKLSPEECLRGLSTAEGTNEFSVYDFINHACKKEIRSSYARVTLSNLMKEGSEFREEILKSIKYRKFQDGGNKKTPTMTIKGLQKLLMILGGKVADAFRYEAFYILQRYLDGDTTMCQEIKGNKRMGSAASYQQFTEKVVKLAEEMETNEVPKVSFVYATKSAAFPGLIKIGKTINMQTRLSNLNIGCAPAPHVVVAVAPTFDNTRDERMAHAFFAEARKEGEFFEVAEESVKNFFHTHIQAQHNMELSKFMV